MTKNRSCLSVLACVVVVVYPVAMFGQATNRDLALAGNECTDSVAGTPAVAAAQSPVHYFRLLLEAPPEQLAQLLSNRPPAVRARLLEKIHEYRELPADERELRLRTTELQWYLMRLLPLDRTNRQAMLQQAPAELRPILEDRLVIWDLLPPPLKDELSRDVQNLQLLFQVEARQAAGVPVPPPKLRQAAELTKQFFELRPAEKDQVLKTLSETERMQIEQALRDFERLSPQDRARCLRAFAVLAAMPAERRAEFLKDAARWQALSPEQRETWRRLVREVPLWPPDPLEAMIPPLPGEVVDPHTASKTNRAD